MTLTADTPTITDTEHTDTEHTDTETSEPSGTVVVELTADQVAQHPDNLRDAGRGIRELTASIAEVGVLVPLIVVPVQAVPGYEFGPAVTHVAVDGNRRQAAARAAGLPLPCIVRPDLASARDTALTMAVTGLARDGLTAREEAGAVQTMLELGIDAAAIGRATGRSRKHIAAARKAASLTDEVTAAVADYPMTLAELAALADWQHDPEATAALLEAIPRGQLDHTLARLTLAQRERKLHAKTARELTAHGVTVTDTEPSYYGDGPRVLTRLRAADAPSGQALTPDEHAQCPGHVAHVEVTIYEADPDEGTDEDTEVSITYGCTDPAAHGHLDLWERPSIRTVHLPDEDVPADEDEQARADRLARAEQARAEAQARAEQEARDARRELIRLNKEADAAQTVRREFLRSCLTAKPRHKAMTSYALRQLLTRDRTVTDWFNDHPWPTGEPAVLAEILGEDPVTTATNAPATRQPIMLWAYVVAAHEKAMPRDAHRDHNPGRADYLRHLIDLGYVPADVERRIIANVYPPTPLIELDLNEPDDQADAAPVDAEPADAEPVDAAPDDQADAEPERVAVDGAETGTPAVSMPGEVMPAA